jgi:hypothetical protein
MRLRGCPTQRSVHTRPTHALWFALWVAVFLGMLAAASTSSASAQDTSTEQEAKTRLSKEELRVRLQSGEKVQNAIIQGDDLIAILRERTLGSTVWIAIVNSVIEGGLDFTTLPATAVDQLKQSKFWNDEDRQRWLTPFLNPFRGNRRDAAIRRNNVPLLPKRERLPRLFGMAAEQLRRCTHDFRK